MSLSFVKFWQVNSIQRERANKPSLLAIQKTNKTLINLWHRNLICISDQRLLQSLPSSSFINFLKTWLRPNNWTFIHGDNVIKRESSRYCLVHFDFNFLKKADLNPKPNTWVLPIYLFLLHFRHHKEKLAFLTN